LAFSGALPKAAANVLPPHGLVLPYEMVNAIQSHNAHHYKVDSHDVVQQPRRNEDKYPCDESNDGRNMRDSEMHHDLPVTARLVSVPKCVDFPDDG
jgi:hypothetical protein